MAEKDEHYIYMMECGEFVKIGRTQDPKKRHATIQQHCPYDVTLSHVSSKPLPYRQAVRSERFLHRHMAHKRHRGEWYKYHRCARHNIVHFIEWEIDSYYNDIVQGEAQLAHDRALWEARANG